MKKQKTTLVTIYTCTPRCQFKATLKYLHRSLFNCPNCGKQMDRNLEQVPVESLMAVKQ